MDAPAMRLFVAILIPPALRAELDACQAGMRRSLPGGSVRWVDSGQVHLTLRFLGNVESSRVGDLQDALRRVGAAFASIPLVAEGIGFFPDSRRPRVVWAGVVDGSTQLSPLQSGIETAVAAFTTERAEARFRSHLTLGRIKVPSPGVARVLAQAAAGLAGRRFGEWVADSFELMRSERSSSGSRHTRLARIPLTAASCTL